MQEPTITEIAAEVIKALGGAVADEFRRAFSNRYVGDTYHDSPTPNSIFYNSGLDVKTQPLPEELAMKSRNFYPQASSYLEKTNLDVPLTINELSSQEFNVMVEELKSYAKKIELYDKIRPARVLDGDVRVFREVHNIVDDIRRHVEKHGPGIVVDDDHDNSYFGYSCRLTDTTWRIPHKPVLEYFSDPDNSPEILDTHYLNTGKHALTSTMVKEMISELEQEDEDTDAYINGILDKIDTKDLPSAKTSISPLFLLAGAALGSILTSLNKPRADVRVAAAQDEPELQEETEEQLTREV
jgi:hypothetical protein